MSHPALLLLFLLLTAANNHALPVSSSLHSTNHEKCDNLQCGDVQIPFPYHLSSIGDSCGGTGGGRLPLGFDAFLLFCNSTLLHLNIGSKSYRVLEFYSDGILVDVPGGAVLKNGATSSCHHYFDVNSFGGFHGNLYYGISTQNILCLYDCEDSSVCDMDCEKLTCQAQGNTNSATTTCTCCYPLSDHPRAWEVGGDGFSLFSQYGCRGFSSWVVPPTPALPKPGIKLEWALPLDSSSKQLCANHAVIINATTVKAGVRCACQNGFVGDGFADGVGCNESCLKDGHEEGGKDCRMKRQSKRKMVTMAGTLVSIFILASLCVLCTIVRRPNMSGRWGSKPRLEKSSPSFCKASVTRLFTYKEVEEATNGFKVQQKLFDDINGTIYSGLLADGTHVVVQKVHCENEQNLMSLLSRIEILSQISHKNIARVLGCCIDSGNTPLIIYELSVNGTLEEHLHQLENQKGGLDWYQRLNIAVEIAHTLGYMQQEIAPPIFHHGLRSASIFLDQDYSVKIAGFGLFNTEQEARYLACNNSESSRFLNSGVHDLGVVLLEIVAGSRRADLPTIALTKIRSGKLEEIVDPRLYYHEQPTFRREQIEIVADLATRCLLFGGDGRLSVMDAARELVHMMKENLDGCTRRGPALEETFSNSSLLQMISMSPDSVYAH